MHRLDKATGYREPETGAGADMVALLRAIEFVKYAFQLRRRNAVAFVDDLQGDPIPVPQTPDRYRAVGWATFPRRFPPIQNNPFGQKPGPAHQAQLSPQPPRAPVVADVSSC